MSTKSLDPTFSFVLDAGFKIFIWSGEKVRTAALAAGFDFL